MANLARFRITLWSNLAALCRRGTDFFESKREQAAAYIRDEIPSETQPPTNIATEPFNGAPEHWLAMVRKRAPGFLQQMEAFSHRAQPVLNNDRAPLPNISSQYLQPEPNVSVDISPNPATTRSERPQHEIHTDEHRKKDCPPLSVDLPENKTNDRPQMQPPEIGQTSKASSKAGQTVLFKAIEPTAADRLNLTLNADEKESEQKPLIFSPKPVNRASGQRISETTVPPARRVPKNVEIQPQRSIEPFHVTAKTPDDLVVPSAQQMPALSIDQPDNKPLVTPRKIDYRISQEATSRHESKHAAIPDDKNSTPESVVRCHYSNSIDDRVSADRFWPNLSGLKKSPSDKDYWPELPTDVWSELCCGQDPANKTQEFADTKVSEALWNE